MDAKQKNIIKVSAISLIALSLIGGVSYFAYKNTLAFKNRMAALNPVVGKGAATETSFDSQQIYADANYKKCPCVKNINESSTFCI